MTFQHHVFPDLVDNWVYVLPIFSVQLDVHVKEMTDDHYILEQVAIAMLCSDLIEMVQAHAEQEQGLSITMVWSK